MLKLGMDENLISIFQKLKNIVPDAVIKQVSIKKANKNFLCLCLDGHTKTIRLYSAENNLNEVCEIEFKILNSGVFIEKFETDEFYQNAGLGKYLYNLALGYADYVGCKNSFGYIEPINAINGISNREKYCKNEEVEFLKNVYKKLVNEIEVMNIEGIDVYKFTDNWQTNEKFEKLDNIQKEVVTEFANVGLMQKEIGE